jgi:hypothetical protein
MHSFFVHVASGLKHFPSPLDAADSRVEHIILGTFVDLVKKNLSA